MIGAVHVAEPASADDVRRCIDGILMERLMLSRTPSLLLLSAAKHTMPYPMERISFADVGGGYVSDDGVQYMRNDAFWTLYDLALSFRKGAYL